MFKIHILSLTFGGLIIFYSIVVYVQISLASQKLTLVWT